MLSFARALLCSATAFFLVLMLSATAATASPKAFSIDAEEASRALLEFGRQAAVQILFASEKVKGVVTNAVHGNYEPIEALKLLLKGTTLVVSERPDGVLVVEPKANAHSTSNGNPVSGNDTDTSTRLAQATNNSSVAKATEENKTKIEEIVVTGSRIPRTAKEGAQEVKVYSKQQIDKSGQTSVFDFLHSLSDVSAVVGETGFQSVGGATAVQLHGLPAGTTLVLLNGRRVELTGVSAGQNSNFFDVNAIPLSVVERIEVVPEGSSAVYGADAIAGVVNIILKKDFDGLEANGKYGSASGTDEYNASLALGKDWTNGSISLIGSYQTRGELAGTQRSITASQDYRAYGGPDNRSISACNPGNVFTTDGSNLPGVGAPFAAVPAGASGTPTQREFVTTANTLNKCSYFALLSVIPKTERQGVFASGHYQLSSSTEFFSEFIFSRTQQISIGDRVPFIFGAPGFAPFTVSASNPFNPFGEAVGVNGKFVGAPRAGPVYDESFFRPLVGLRGRVFNDWQWEIAAWDSTDWTTLSVKNASNFKAIQDALNSSDPATALNPFVAGPAGSPKLLQSLVSDQTDKFSGRLLAANGFLRGPLLHLPSGPVQVVFGGEYNRGRLYTNDISDPTMTAGTSSFERSNYAMFGEARVPLIAGRADGHRGETLAVTLAGHYDHYAAFGSRTTPQYGVEWRPDDALLIRGNYGESFKAPSLFELDSPQFTFQQESFVDPLKGNQPVNIALTLGGNPHLNAETGRSRTLGFVYSSKAIPDLTLSVTHWMIDESGSIQQLDPQVVIDNASLFPSGTVVRGPGVNGAPGPLVQVKDFFLNFGDISERGFDMDWTYKLHTRFGQWTAELNTTNTYHYTAAFTPGAPVTDRAGKANDDGNFAPRWKGTATIGWNMGPYTANVAARYVGKYQDYDPLPNGTSLTLGKFWIYDASVRYAIGQALAGSDRWLNGAYLQLGGVNLFNTLPQFSNFGGGLLGFDPANGDIRGRFLYGQIGVKW